MDWTAIVMSFITAIPPTIVAAAALIVSLRNGRKTEAVDAKLTKNTSLTSSLVQTASETRDTLDHIQTKTNGSLTHLSNMLSEATVKVAEQSRFIDSLKTRLEVYASKLEKLEKLEK